MRVCSGIRLVVLGGCVLGLATSAHGGELRAGAAKVSISPTADEFPYKIGREKAFVGVHDDVYARALVLDNGTTKVVLVSLEVTVVPEPQTIVAEVAKAVGVDAANVLITASHTHESLTVFIHGTDLLPVQKEEIDHVRQGAVAAARAAAGHLQPARIAFARTEAYVNINNGEEAGLKNWYDAKGASDKTLDVLRVESVKGEPLALLIDYATHAEVMYRSVTRDGGYEVSGDLPGAVSRMLETNAGGAPVTLFFPAAEADQLSMLKSLQPATEKMAEADEGAAGWGIMDELARRLTAAVLDASSGLKAGMTDVPLRVNVSSVTCPGGACASG